MITKEQMAEWRSLQGEGLTSALGEYTPREFWELLDEFEQVNTLLDGFVALVDPACTVERDHPQAYLADALRAVWEHRHVRDGQEHLREVGGV